MAVLSDFTISAFRRHVTIHTKLTGNEKTIGDIHRQQGDTKLLTKIEWEGNTDTKVTT
jgi:hypothetical protein